MTGFWRYDPSMWRHSWKDHDRLQKLHRQWHADHEHPRSLNHLDFHHSQLVHEHRKVHHHRVRRWQEGDATWYDLEGKTGACGRPLRGLYAAHKSYPCGSLVSVRRGDRYVHVRIMDRGPFGPGRKIDLAKEAFSRLAAPSEGVIKVRVYLLED
jgi:rare lipoprotein A